jgi:16S rRNA (cytidine1402-2'-O)-methyltransferase
MLKAPGKLFIVATPIGHPKDITLRAMETLSRVDFIICEDIRNASRLLKQCGIENKPFAELNEHNETDQAQEMVSRLLDGESAALISDCGTPVFADPGTKLINYATSSGIEVVPIPGPSSLITALSVLDRPFTQFVFGGFLPRDKNERINALKILKGYRLPIILMDTPYRLEALLTDVSKIFSPRQQILLATDLTLKTENIYRGTIQEVQQSLVKNKAEFILVLYSAEKFHE